MKNINDETMQEIVEHIKSHFNDIANVSIDINTGIDTGTRSYAYDKSTPEISERLVFDPMINATVIRKCQLVDRYVIRGNIDNNSFSIRDMNCRSIHVPV